MLACFGWISDEKVQFVCVFLYLPWAFNLYYSYSEKGAAKI